MSWFINDVCETSGIAILNIKGSDYRRSSSLISKNEAINVMQNVEPKKVEHHKT